MSLKKCIIIVPVYREVPNELEQLSLGQLNKIIKDSIDIFLVGHDKINYDEYKKILVDCNVFNKNYDEKYFKDTKSYSQLCLSYDFYNDFSDYEYMLIYQTDCWLFKNDVEKFCDMGYDYIGPPIYSKYSFWPSFNSSNRPVVGNGGFSLRKISKMKEITDPNGYIYKTFGKEKYEEIDTEDVAIADIFSHMLYMNIPDYKIAEKFGFDFFQDGVDAVSMIKNVQPMGAHRVFMLHSAWKYYIQEFNDEHIIELCDIEYKNWRQNFRKNISK